MKTYNFSDIVKIDKKGIIFSDETFINFGECVNEWAIENNIRKDETVCVALRHWEKESMYFIFYTKERIKIFFDSGGLFKQRKNREHFQQLQDLLNRFGFSSYDIT